MRSSKYLFTSLALLLFTTTAYGQNVYWMSPTGDDAALGDEYSPLLSLSGVHTRVSQDQPANEIIVAIEPGRYFNQSIAWRYFVDGQPIHFMSADEYRRDYLGLSVSSIRKPHFLGCDSLPSGRNQADAQSKCHQNEWFNFTVRSAQNGERSSLSFTNIRVTNYLNGLRFASDRNNAHNYNGGHLIENCEFQYIGNLWTSNPNGPLEDWKAYRALGLTNSRYTQVLNNSFLDITSGFFGPHLHAIYMAHYASDNEVRGNIFDNVVGDAIRVRDASNNNVFANNRITNSGRAAYSDWFCNHERVNCSKFNSSGIAECPSEGNEFINNEYGSRYNNSNEMRLTCFFWREECEPARESNNWGHCSASGERVYLSGNRQINIQTTSVSTQPKKKKKSKSRFNLIQWLSEFLSE